MEKTKIKLKQDCAGKDGDIIRTFAKDGVYEVHSDLADVLIKGGIAISFAEKQDKKPALADNQEKTTKKAKEK